MATVYEILDEIAQADMILRDNAGNYYDPRDVQAILDEGGPQNNHAGWEFRDSQATWDGVVIRLLDDNGYQMGGEPLYTVVSPDEAPY